MRFKLTILLAILNIAVFSLIFYVDRAQSARNLFEGSSRLILDPAFVQGVRDVQIRSNRTGDTWRLVRTASGGWDVTEPVHWKANPFAVQQLLFQFKALSWESRFPVDSLESAGQSLASYDLETPPLQIELSNGTRSVSLKIGAPTEIGNRLYTLSPDNDYILVIGRGLRDTLQGDANAFLDKRLFGVGSQESRVLQIQDRSASNVRVRMERASDGWRFVSPIEAEADSDRVQALLADWQSAEGDQFRRADAGETELAGDTLTLTLEGLSDRESVHFGLEPAEGQSGRYLARKDGYSTVFLVKREPVDELRRAQDVLREKRILRRHAEDWSSMEIRYGELVTTLQVLENCEWQVLSTNAEGQLLSRPADPAVIADMRNLFRTLEAVRFVSDAPSETDRVRYGLDDPQRRVVLRKGDGTQIDLLIGGIRREDDETLLYAATHQQASVFLIRPHVLASIPLDPLHYRERTLLAYPVSTDFRSIVLENLSEGSSLTLTEGQHAMLIAGLKSYLRDVEVARFLNQPFADPLRLDATTEMPWAYRLQAEAIEPTGAVADTPPVSLFLSERLGGTTQYVGYPPSGLVGVLPTEIIELLDTVLAEFPDDPGQPPVSAESTQADPES